MIRLTRGFTVVAVLTTACQSQTTTGGPQGSDAGPATWRFTQAALGVEDRVFNDVWADSAGNVYVVGQYGTIMTNRGSNGVPGAMWHDMASPTKAHLTSIIGVPTGGAFGLAANLGEMFAVGWHGTILHFNPNPDKNAQTDDGAWSLIAGPEGAGLRALVRVDPACPDYDGDGIPDDGDITGYAGDGVCKAGTRDNCDDNCRETPNGPMRPIINTNGDTCIGPGDNPDPNLAAQQRDTDSDGFGDVCDADEQTPQEQGRFDADLFGVWARQSGNRLQVVAVGGDGALVTYDGVSAGATPTPPTLPLTDPAAWVAQVNTSFRFTDDCPPGTPAGQTCTDSPRLPPSCPAMCNPRKTNCSCPVDQGQCCDGSATTGVGCKDASCPPAANACDGATGVCRALCPDCVRRLTSTLRSVSGDDNNVVAVGADGQILVGMPDDPDGLWSALTCVNPPKPLDDRPLIANISLAGGGYLLVGSGGSTFSVSPGAGGCVAREPGEALSGGALIESRRGMPPAFLADVFPTGRNAAWIVGDRGLLVRIDGAAITQIPTDVTANLHGIWQTIDSITGEANLWVIGASGVLLNGRFY